MLYNALWVDASEKMGPSVLYLCLIQRLEEDGGGEKEEEEEGEEVEEKEEKDNKEEEEKEEKEKEEKG